MPTVNVRVLKKPGEWIAGFSKFVPAGDVVAVDEYIFKNRLIKMTDRFKVTTEPAAHDSTVAIVATADESAAEAATDQAARDKPASEIMELGFPHAELLVRNGITTVDQLAAFVTDNGDAWVTHTNGIDAAAGKEILAFAAKAKKPRK